MFHVRAHENRRTFEELHEDWDELFEKYWIGRAIAHDVNVVPQFCCDVVFLLDFCSIISCCSGMAAKSCYTKSGAIPTKICIAQPRGEGIYIFLRHRESSGELCLPQEREGVGEPSTAVRA